MCDYKNIDKNQLSDMFGWVIFEKEEWEKMISSFRLANNYYEKKRKADVDYMEDYFTGRRDSYKDVIRQLETGVPF